MREGSIHNYIASDLYSDIYVTLFFKKKRKF